MQLFHLINLDSSVDLSDEEKCRIESDSSRQQPEGDDHHQGVRKVEERGHKLVNVQLRVEVEDAVSEDVECWSSRHDEGPPPPVVVLSAKLEVDHDDGDLWARDDQNDKDKEEESEEIVELVLVDGWEDEEELDEAGAEGQNAGHQGAENRVHVPNLETLRNCLRNTQTFYVQ